MISVRLKLFLALVCLFPKTGDASLDWLKDYEFKSYYCLDNVYFFSIYNKTTFSSIWLEQNKERHGISVLDFEAETNTLSLSFNDQAGTLTLLKPEVSAIDGVCIIGQTDSSDTYEKAVRIAAEFQLQNPGAVVLDAPMPSSVRASLLKYKGVSHKNENSSEGDKTFYTNFMRSVDLERRRLIREKRRSAGTKVSH